jgi:uncharacterized protein YajQ (UPF0234 family)
MPPKDKPDQADILALNEQLNGQVANLSAELASAKTLHTTATTELADVKTKLTAAEANVLALTKERDTLKASQADFDGKVAAEVAKRGISGKAIDEPKNNGTSGGTSEELFAAYNAITDPKAKEAFFAKNEVALRKILIAG